MNADKLTKDVTLYAGDCLDVLKTLAPDSVDSVVTDPPYHLTSIVKRFATVSAKDLEVARANPHRRTSSGFMGKQWDGGDIAFRAELWAEVCRVLKPGGHLVAFGGTRTYHRMACAIEDAGFEIRDSIQWLYGSGFPKSHDVSKGIDKAGLSQPDHLGSRLELAQEIRAKREAATVSRSELASWFPYKEVTKNWERTDAGQRIPTELDYQVLVDRIGLSPHWRSLVRAEDARLKIEGMSVDRRDDGTVYGLAHNGSAYSTTTDLARQWAGFGTALKPACEPIVLARKPLSEGTVAANVLKWGTGALNIDGCRVASEPIRTTRNTALGIMNDDGWQPSPATFESHANGRWPANVIHDGSDEVVGAFPDARSSGHVNESRSGEGRDTAIWGNAKSHAIPGVNTFNDSGSAARFFYTAKAGADDRLGSRHPTVKPLDLMQYLVRLVTPPKGLVLDPFAGTGTTGEAAMREGCRAILIEREAEYQDDIRRRMKLAMSGPDERAREAIKAKLKDKPVDHGPLFGDTWDEMWKAPLTATNEDFKG